MNYDKPCIACGEGIPYDDLATMCDWCGKDEGEAYFDAILRDPPERVVLAALTGDGGAAQSREAFRRTLR